MSRRVLIVAFTASVILALGLLMPDVAFAADDATFASFYRKTTNIQWGLAAIAAVVVGGLAFFTAGALAVPGATAIGTWIGGLFGYSGVAATNFGLAMLGGGAIASGGLGIAGGTALLGAALSFSTDIVLDYSVNKASEAYDHRQFVKDSEKMLTMPLPRRKSGPKAYKEAMEVLDRIDKSELLATSEKNQKIVMDAILVLQATKPSDPSVDDLVRIKTLASLLHFIVNDYQKSEEYASEALQLSKAKGVRHTLPAFLFATASLYKEKLDTRAILDNFAYSIQEEPKNPLAPVMYAVFLDRLSYRMNDEALNASALGEVIRVPEKIDLRNSLTAIYTVCLSRHLIQLKIEQQKILSLTSTSNKTIATSKRTAATLDRALIEYFALLEGAKYVSGALAAPKVRPVGEGLAHVDSMRDELEKYSQDRHRLQNLVAKFQSGQSKPVSAETPST